MKDRKQHVIKMAHQLFIDKGFQATSIQDILDYSGIAKGTFYNYFSSKNELLIAIFKTLFMQMEKERNELLIGQDPSNIDVFIKQIELHVEMNRSNNLSTLFEEVFFSNDKELKEFIKKGQLRIVRWLYGRFLDLFGEDKKPYLLDCAVMFLGILNHNFKYYKMSEKPSSTVYRVVRYSVDRLVKIVDEVSESGDQLLNPDLLDYCSPDGSKSHKSFHQKLHQLAISIKKPMKNDDSKGFIEHIDFIMEELTDSKEPRKFLIETTLTRLKSEAAICKNSDFETFAELVEEYLKQGK